MSKITPQKVSARDTQGSTVNSTRVPLKATPRPTPRVTPRASPRASPREVVAKKEPPVKIEPAKEIDSSFLQNTLIEIPNSFDDDIVLTKIWFKQSDGGYERISAHQLKIITSSDILLPITSLILIAPQTPFGDVRTFKFELQREKHIAMTEIISSVYGYLWSKPTTTHREALLKLYSSNAQLSSLLRDPEVTYYQLMGELTVFAGVQRVGEGADSRFEVRMVSVRELPDYVEETEHQPQEKDQLEEEVSTRLENSTPKKPLRTKKSPLSVEE